VDVYPDVYSKLALALVSAQVAKQSLVSEFGVGEDLPFTFFGWREGNLVAIMAFSQELMGLSITDRFPTVQKVGEVLRRLYWVDGITFVAEGFQSLDLGSTKGKRLAAEFANNNRNVHECVTVSHVVINGKNQPDSTLVSIPYDYVVGRDLVWGESIAYSKGVGRVLLDSPVIALLALCLKMDVVDVVLDEFDAVLETVVRDGVNIQEFGSRFDDDE